MSYLGTRDLVKGTCYKTRREGYLGKYRNMVYSHTVSTGPQSEISTYSYIFENGKINIDSDDEGQRFIEVPCESHSSSSSAAASTNASAESRILFLEQQLALAKAELLKQQVKTRSSIARRRKTRSRRYV
jgi:hypothetical protein